MLGSPVRIVVAQVGAVPGDVATNFANIFDTIATARRAAADIVVLPELATTAYVLGDRWEYDAFIRETQEINERIREASRGLTVIWGSIKADFGKMGEDGRVRKYNAAFIASHGRWISNGTLDGFVPKTNLPKYRIFDDARHFYPAGKLAAEMQTRLETLLAPFPLVIKGKRYNIALSVCEDLWQDEYNEKPAQIYSAHDSDLIIDISCSPWTYGKWHARENMLKRRVKDTGIPILYVNAIGLENNTKNLIWFDGDSALIDAEGRFRWRGQQHKEQIHILDLDDLDGPLPERTYTGIKEIHDATVAAMKAFYAPFARVVVGLSGGIDSALALALLTEALGAKRLLAVNMPTEFNSETTRGLAALCARNLGVEYVISPIQEAYEEELRALQKLGMTPSALDRENIQAVLRGTRLNAIAKAQGSMHGGAGAFTCNGNKTEMALNYFTLYGDGAGAAAFLADLWKGQIYELARYINERAGRELIPQGILDIVPSAELSKDQAVDEGKGDPIFFPYHDQLLRAFTELRWDPTTVLEHLCESNEALEQKLGCAPGTVARYFNSRRTLVDNLEWAWRQYNTEFKRGQTPPVFLTSRRAFGFDRRDTIAAGYLTKRYQELKQAYLAGELVA
ncbi:MAG TPA: NAD(+) synthase [Candidatus Paceibacterota bacterium]|nr:NAD(+) synthase [Candidatus Paceibacterota bacterium]